MINFNNNNITGMSYNGHNIKKAYGCDGNLVWESQNPPVFGGKWIATYQDGHTESAECGGSTEIVENDISKENLVSVEIKDCVTSLGLNAFGRCNSLTSVTISDSVTSIGSQAFYRCSGLTNVTIGNGVTEIGNSAFYGCSGLTSVTIPNSVTSIDNSVFFNCSSLTSITVGSGVTSIGQAAFGSCNSLISVVIEAATPPTLAFMPFYDTNNCPIYVPDVDAYKNAEGWSDLASRIQPIV